MLELVGSNCVLLAGTKQSISAGAGHLTTPTVIIWDVENVSRRKCQPSGKVHFTSRAMCERSVVYSGESAGRPQKP